MWPVLMFAYYKLAKREEGRLLEEFGEEFQRYKSMVPAFVPRFRRVKRVAEGIQDLAANR